MSQSQSNSSLLQLYNLEGEFDEILRQYNKEYANYVVLLKNITYPTSSQEVKTSIDNLDLLNEKLLRLNKQMTGKLSEIQPGSLQGENKSRLDTVISMYGILLKEQSKIKQMNNEYEYIYAENKSQTRNVNHQYAQYIFWSIVSFVVVFLLCRLFFFQSLPLNTFKFFFWVVLLFILSISLLYSYLSTGFLIVCLLLAYIILGFMKILPMP
jgi:hypothetical protein